MILLIIIIPHIRDTSISAMIQQEIVLRKLQVMQSIHDVQSSEDLDETLECSVCMEPYDKKKKKRIDLQCDPERPNIYHTYCKECLDSWSKKSKICPKCRRPITSSNCFTFLAGYFKTLCPCFRREE